MDLPPTKTSLPEMKLALQSKTSLEHAVKYTCRIQNASTLVIGVYQARVNFRIPPCFAPFFSLTEMNALQNILKIQIRLSSLLQKQLN